MASKLKSGEAARMLNLTPQALRTWEARGYLTPHRTSGGQRRYERRLIAAIKDSLEEGLSAQSACSRAIELVKSGRYDEPKRLHERLDHIEAEMRGLRRDIKDRLDELLGVPLEYR